MQVSASFQIPPRGSVMVRNAG